MSSSTVNGNLPGGLARQSAPRLLKLDPTGTVFSEFTKLAIKHSAVNLGQGFPTLPVPEFIREAAGRTALDSGLVHQYTRSEGHPKLVQVLSKFYSEKIGRSIDPLTEIVTTVGATEAIYSTIQAFVDRDDEVIMMQPFYDSYPASVALAGGKPVVVSLRPPKGHGPAGGAKTSHDWKLDLDELRAAVTPKTKLIIVNNPHNPVGKVFTREELLGIAAIAEEFDLLVMADEVYETLVYSDSVSPFIKFASLPGMFERTITLGSVGKMFGVTGWKIGWVIAPAPIVRSVQMVHQFVPFSIATPLQEAVATALEQAIAGTFFEETRAAYEALRDRLFTMLSSVNLNPTLPHGGYFILADTSSVEDPAEVSEEQLSALKADVSERELNRKDGRRDFRICRHLTTEAGVTAIPPSAFYDDSAKGAEVEKKEVAGYLARFAFCKSADMIDRAGENLKHYFSEKKA
ncbi:pyridoxal phosphate-dependent transferase [Cladochytrium replicatum]|nr:pyridoxal phosphate-dependent transferase [Cladochytrium replicatum]